MAKKKTTVRKSLPSLVSFLLCDGVARDPNSGKVTLYGLFDRINPGAFPATVGFWLFAQVLGGSGSHAFEWVIADSKGKEMLNAKFDQEFGLNAGTKKNVIVQVAGLEFKKPGKYSVSLRSDGKVIGSPREMEVVQAATT